MKIIVNQENHQIGPYSQEELRQLIYSGTVKRSSVGCKEGSADWVPVDELLRAGESVPPVAPPKINSAEPVAFERLRDPKERMALIWLYVASIPGWLLLAVWTVASFGLLLAIAALGVLLTLVGELWFAAYIRTNAVRVSETQLPELYGIVQSCCARLGMAQPEVYVMQQNVWNAFASKVLNRQMVVLLSGAVDSLLLKGDLQQLTWLVGHELGHHRAGHLDFVRKLANVGDWCVWLKLWYSRRSEMTCDRVGLYCTGNLKTSQLALINATVGAQLAGKVNLEEAANQWHRHQHEFWVKYRTLYATHPHLLARLAYLGNAAAELGVT